MAHNLDLFAFELPAVDEWLSGDDRVLAFVVSDADGNPVDISNATVSWHLFEREYHDDPADAVLSGGDASVEIVTDTRVDTTAGEFEVRLDAAATADRWGTYYQRPSVEDADGNVASWRGRVDVTA